MDRRQELQNLLMNILGSTNVYFQPPSSHRIEYPCIIFERAGIQTTKADNSTYRKTTRYSLNYIRLDPTETEVINKLLELPMCAHDRFYTSDGLNHDTFTIYY